MDYALGEEDNELRLVTSTNGIISPIHPRQGLYGIEQAGFKELVLELGAFCQPEVLWPGGRKQPADALRDTATIRRGYRELLKEAKAFGLQFTVGSLPTLQALTERRDLDERLIEVSADCIAACEEVTCRVILVPPLFAGVLRGQEWDVNRRYLLELAGQCQCSNTKLLLTNNLRNVSGHLTRGICAEAEEANEWVEALNQAVGMERFGFCMDVGVCNICGQEMRELLHMLKPHLKAVIVRENDGQSNSEGLPLLGESSTDWLGMIRGLREIGFDGTLIFRYGSTVRGLPTIVRDGVLSERSLDRPPLILSLAKEVAEYFVWQIQMERAMKKYGSIVLFGAGNMCRNYMMNYGKDYPPLFTCDNNPSRWGEYFCGLEIKPPEALRELPEDCGVLICNIYYREVREQLRELGVKNIAYFNDEYMPSFSFDRIPMR